MEVDQTLSSHLPLPTATLDPRKRSRSEESFPQFDSFRDKLNQSPLCAVSRKNQVQKRQKTNPWCYVRMVGGRVVKVELDDHFAKDLFIRHALPVAQVVAQVAELMGVDPQGIRLLHRKKLLGMADEVHVPHGKCLGEAQRR